MKVFAKSKVEFEDILSINEVTDKNVEYSNAAFISILGPGKFLNPNKEFFATPYFKNKHPNVLTLDFDDVESKEQGKIFTDEMARDVVNFIIKHKDKEFIIVHCAAGISRSGAVAQFINDYFIKDKNLKESFSLINPRVIPNQLVFKKLKEYYEKIIK